MATTAFVNVQVPEDLVIEVYEFIARRRAQVSSVVPAPAVAEASDLALAVRAYREATPNQRKVLDLLLASPGKKFTSIDLDNALRGLQSSDVADDYTLNGTLGSFGTKAAAHYNGVKPYEEKQDPTDRRKRYWMSVEVAEAIQRAERSE